MSIQAHDFLDKSHIPAARAGALKTLHEESIVALSTGPAGWHGPDDIETLVGLEGLYLWSEDPISVEQIEFSFDSSHVGSQGRYKITSNLKTKEDGTFYCMPNNPAIGWASITLIPRKDPTALRSFVVAGMDTDKNWRINILLLNRLGEHGPIQPPLSAVRMG